MSSSAMWKIFGAMAGVGLLMAVGGASYFVFFRGETSAQSRSDSDDDEDK